MIESLIYYLHHAVLRNQIDTRTVENVVCTLRNLSYRHVLFYFKILDYLLPLLPHEDITVVNSLYLSRIQEVKDENYDPKADFETTQYERSKSAPSESPKGKKKESSKKKKIGQSSAMNGSESMTVYFILMSLVICIDWKISMLERCLENYLVAYKIILCFFSLKFCLNSS